MRTAAGSLAVFVVVTLLALALCVGLQSFAAWRYSPPSDWTSEGRMLGAMFSMMFGSFGAIVFALLRHV